MENAECHNTPAATATKYFSDFSIDALLNKFGNVKKDEYRSSSSTNIAKSQHAPFSDDNDDVSECDYKNNDNNNQQQQCKKSDTKVNDEVAFSWLNCSRFKPPKLPRSKRKVKRNSEGRGPRIPFSPGQVSLLEMTFRQSHYLSTETITKLARALQLTETRVKIWFQNRRARNRREAQLLSSPGVNRDANMLMNSSASSTLGNYKKQGKFSLAALLGPSTMMTSVTAPMMPSSMEPPYPHNFDFYSQKSVVQNQNEFNGESNSISCSAPVLEEVHRRLTWLPQLPFPVMFKNEPSN